MKKLLLFLTVALFVLSAGAQTSLLYGLTGNGGTYGDGTLFSFNPANNALAKVVDFTGTNNGSGPYGTPMQANNGLLYGLTYQGGSTNNGCVFSFDPSTNVLTRVVSLQASSGSNPQGSLIQASNGLLYGLTSNNGAHGGGSLFSIDITTNGFSPLVEFSDTATGTAPTGSLLQASNGLLYGLASQGGAREEGTLFSYNTNTNVFTKLVDLSAGPDQAGALGSLIQATNGLLYGMTEQGGSNNEGSIFSFNTSTNVFTTVVNFNNTGNGESPYGSLMQASNGLLYGMTSHGGANHVGTVFSFDPTTDSLTTVFTFINGTGGSYPSGTLMQDTNGLLYGMTTDGGTVSGTIFSYDITSGVLNQLADFTNQTGYGPWYGTLLQVAVPPACQAAFALHADTSIHGYYYGYNLSTGNNLTYLWNFGDGDTSSLQFPSHQYASTGVYNVCLTVSGANGCVSTHCDSSFYASRVVDSMNYLNIINPTLIPEVNNEPDFSMFPNPAAGSVNITINDNLVGSMLTVTDITGREIVNTRVQSSNSKLPTTGFANGIYFITVSSAGNNKLTKKLVVSR